VSTIRAAGFVLFRRSPGRHLYLVLTNARHGDPGLPKGKCDPGEGDLEAAVRETEEETGIPAGDLRVQPAFLHSVSYMLRGKPKRVAYFGAETDRADVRISGEHASFEWLDLDAALGRVRHENLRRVLRAAATYFKDPVLRRGLAPADARTLLEARGADARLVAHSGLVAAAARAIAAAWPGEDAAFVEAAAWLHDIGRLADHQRHPVEGFRLLCEAGWPGYAPPCLSHYAKGRPKDACGDLAAEMWSLCDLDTFETFEKIVALADFTAAGDRRVPLEERHADLVRRYGKSDFVDGSFAAARRIAGEVEAAAGGPLEAILRRA